jgi:hypothetical protein
VVPIATRPRRASALLALALALGCLPEASPSWLLTDPRLIVVEQWVVATGELSPPLEDDGVRRREGLPGDRLRLVAHLAGPDGPITPEQPPIWVRSRSDFIYLPRDQPLPLCADDGLDPAIYCRVDGDTLTLPPVPPGGFQGVDENFVFVVASTAPDVDAESCLEFLLGGGGDDERFDCHFGRERLSYGPYYRVQELAGLEVTAPVLEPDRYAEGLRFDLTFRGPAGERTQIAARGDRVVMRPDETLTIDLGTDEDDLQIVDEGSDDEGKRETLLARFFASAPVLPDTAVYELPSADGIRAPADGAFIFASVDEDGRENRSASLQWFYIQLVLGDPEAPP